MEGRALPSFSSVPMCALVIKILGYEASEGQLWLSKYVKQPNAAYSMACRRACMATQSNRKARKLTCNVWCRVVDKIFKLTLTSNGSQATIESK